MYNDSVRYTGHMQTAQTLIITSSICSQNVLLELNYHEKYHPVPLKFKIDAYYREIWESSLGFNGLRLNQEFSAIHVYRQKLEY